jgi:hypothetical protein
MSGWTLVLNLMSKTRNRGVLKTAATTTSAYDGYSHQAQAPEQA